MKKIFLIFLLFIIKIGCQSKNDNNNIIKNKQEIHYLLKPSGLYTVGFKDIYLINDKICPDAFYLSGQNENNFSATNKQYCHEINLRIYYPSNEKFGKNSTYYRPTVMNQINYYKKQFNLRSSELNALESLLEIKTNNFYNLIPLENSKFPLVVFLPGSGLSAQFYNNIINNLVSHGYIILGMNSVFVNGDLKLENGQLVEQPKIYNDASRLQNLADLKFILQNLNNLDYGIKLKQQINLNNINFLGHSMGAMNIVNLLKEKEISNLKSVLLMDPGNIIAEANYPIKPIRVPTMFLWASNFKNILKGANILAKNNFEVILAPAHNNINYSNHLNFTDLSTLQYHPGYQITLIKKSLLNTKRLGIGSGNGLIIA